MAAKYDFKTSPDIQGEKEQPTLYPQIVVSGTKNLKDLAKDIARRSTVHEGTVVGLLCDLESIIANYLADGYNVKLGELGTFSATLTCRKVTDKSEIRAASVHFDNIKFKPTRKFRKEVSSSPMDSIEEVLNACGLSDAFEYVVSGEQFKESKPEPDIYLHALDLLGLPANRCCCVEDSVPGITAGKRAGLTVIAKREERFGFSQDAADKIIDQLPELLELA